MAWIVDADWVKRCVTTERWKDLNGTAEEDLVEWCQRKFLRGQAQMEKENQPANHLTRKMAFKMMCMFVGSFS